MERFVGDLQKDLSRSLVGGTLRFLLLSLSGAMLTSLGGFAFYLYQAQNSIQQTLLVFWIVTSLLAAYVLVAVYIALSFKIKLPLKDLTKRIHQYHANNGHLDLKKYSHRDDELGEISRAFLDLTGRLELRVLELEKIKDLALRAQLEAEAASRSKSSFLANMSHEIRTPLNGIITLTEYLIENPDELNRADSLEMIQRSGHTLLGIINDILDLSKIEAGKMELAPAPTNLSKLINETVNLVLPLAIHKKIEVRVVTDDFENLVVVDSLRLKQVLMNLLSNAIKFTEKGQVNLKVSRAVTTSEEIWVNFSVEDSGIGIRPEQQQLLFKDFSQAESSTTKRFGGTGLGLSISQKIIKMMGGEIKVYSQEGMGSRFYFSLKFRIHQLAVFENHQAKDLTESGATHFLTGHSVLLVEDNQINQIIAAKILRRWGAKVIAANNGQEALKLYETYDFDVILMDCQMPVMDGYEATQEIRSLERERGVRAIGIVALTANAFKEDEAKCIDAGMDEFVSKPIHLPDLERALRRLLNSTAIVSTGINRGQA